jgi:hypothetical protein
VNVGVSDCVVSSNIMVNGLTTIFNGLAVRYIDEDRFWYALLATGETLRLYSWDNPTLTLEAESSGVGPNTGTRTMTVTMIGTSLSLSISGSGNTADCTSSLHQTATRHGLAGLYDTVGAGVGSIPYDTFEITGDAPPSGGNPWYHNAQQRVRTSIDRRFEKRGLLWTPSYALGRAA